MPSKLNGSKNLHGKVSDISSNFLNHHGSQCRIFWMKSFLIISFSAFEQKKFLKASNGDCSSSQFIRFWSVISSGKKSRSANNDQYIRFKIFSRKILLLPKNDVCRVKFQRTVFIFLSIPAKVESTLRIKKFLQESLTSKRYSSV